MINQALRLLEGIVIIIFLAILGYGGLTLTRLNNVSKATWDLPTLTPTPLFQLLILPGGKAPAIPPLETKSRIIEIPQHLRPIMQSYGNIPFPTPAPQQGVRIQIPALNIDAPIVQGDEPEQLKKGVGQHLGTANPGEVGNMVLSGHNDTFGEVFRYLDRLKPGDEIIIYTFTRSYTYIVDEWTLVEPSQVEVMDPTNYESVTLISCYPYLVDNQRIIVRAHLSKDLGN
jgi:sortase A